MTPTLHTDGGARGNPGPAGIGAILKDGPRVLGEVAMSIGVATNNVAEYQAVITGLELALEQGVRELEVYMDSQLVVSQLKGEWKIKNADLKPLALRARSLMNRFDRINLSHVPRELNHEADRLANQAMDQAALDMAQDEESRAALGQRSLLE